MDKVTSTMYTIIIRTIPETGFSAHAVTRGHSSHFSTQVLYTVKAEIFGGVIIFGILQNGLFGGGKFSVKPVFQASVLVLHVYSTGSIGIFSAFYFR